MAAARRMATLLTAFMLVQSVLGLVRSDQYRDVEWIFLCGISTLGLLLSHLDATAVARSFRHETPVRLIGGYLIFVAVGLAIVWLGMWGAYAFAGRPTPIEPEAFKVVAALDLSFMVPMLTVGGVLLWRRRAWGYVIATIAAIQDALYPPGAIRQLGRHDQPRCRRGARRGTDLESADDFHSARGDSPTEKRFRRFLIRYNHVIRYLLAALLTFGAINAFAGGYYGLSGANGVPLEWLAGSPFSDYFIPSLILFVVVGGVFSFAAIAVFMRSRLARVSAFVAGTVVLVWIGVQLAIIGYVSWMQPTTLLAGVFVLILAWLLPTNRTPVAHSHTSPSERTTQRPTVARRRAGTGR
jgi:hypothetical protein